MPFSLINTGSTFQRDIDIAFHGMINKVIVVYLDNVTVYSKNRNDHLSHLKQIFKHCRKYGISLNPKKSIFAVTESKLLGFVQSKQGMFVEME